MLLIFAAIFAAVFALAAAFLMKTPGHSKAAEKRLQEIESRFVPAAPAAAATDVRKKEVPLSRFGWLDQLLSRINLRARLHLILYQAGVSYSVETLLLISVAGWLAASLLVWLRTDAVLISALIGLVALPMPFLWIARLRAQRLTKLGHQLPEALDMLVSALRVGHSMMTAIGFLAKELPEPLGAEFRKCFEQQTYGTDLRAAMVDLARRTPIQDIRIFVAAVLIQKETGGNLAEVLEKVALTIRERTRLKKQIHVHTAQGRLTGWILSLLPVTLGFLMYLVHPEGISLLWTTGIGIRLLMAAAGMTMIGGLIIRKIVNVRV